MRPIVLQHHVMVYKVLWRNMQTIKLGTPGEPLHFSISALGSFMCVYTIHGTKGFTSHPKDEAKYVTHL